MLKRFRKILVVGLVILSSALGFIATLPIHYVLGVTDSYCVTQRMYGENVGGVATEFPVTHTLGTWDFDVTVVGTFTITLASGTSGSITDVGGSNPHIAGSPLTLTVGANTVTTSGNTGVMRVVITSVATINWSNTNTWASSSGGKPGNGAPTSTVNVHMDANSFPSAGETLTVDATSSCLNMDWTGATNSPTIASTQLLTMNGNVTFIAAMTVNFAAYSPTYAGTGIITFNGYTGNLHGLNISGTSHTFADNLNSTGYVEISLTAGTLDTGSHVVNVGTGNISISGAGAKTLTLGTSVVTTTAWSYSGSNLAITANGATINDSGNFTGGGANYNGATFNYTAVGTCAVSGSNSGFTAFNGDSTKTQTFTFTDGTTQTAGTFGLSGSNTHIHTLQGSGAAGWNLIRTAVSPTYANLDYLSVSHSNVSPAVNVFYAGTHSTNGGNNTGWFFIAPDAPTVTTQAASGVTQDDAYGNGTITNLGAGNQNCALYGFDWGTSTGVYTGSVTSTTPIGAVAFQLYLQATPDLIPGTHYFYRAKANNSIGWGYGGELQFTVATVGVPTNLSVSSNGVVSWTPATNSDGTLIVRGTGGYPTTPTDGFALPVASG
jgi:hypothetical protein